MEGVEDASALEITQEEKVRYERTTAISDRHASLLELIRDGDLSSKLLAEKLGVSEPTVNRDIEFLRSRGYEINAVRVDSKWAYRIGDAMVVREQSASSNREGAR